MKIELKEKVDKLLKATKLKRTQPRRMILSVLLAVGKPQTAEGIASAIGKGCPNRVTVYRTLESLVEAGLAHRAYVDDRSQYYETADRCSESQCHPHFVCTDCGQTHCLTGASVPMATSTPAGFIINRQQVRLEGICPACRKTETR
jgi:Fe2+ or Zn2+ uptake regulation protein